MIRALRAQVYTGFRDMKVSTLKALSPADGRYADKVDGLRNIFSEFGLIRYRVLIEVRWLQCLADEAQIAELEPLSSVMKDVLNHIVDDFSLDDAERIKNIEATTNHDVKAIEYFIRGIRLSPRDSRMALELSVSNLALRRYGEAARTIDHMRESSTAEADGQVP